jgi:hypothetical protein
MGTIVAGILVRFLIGPLQWWPWYRSLHDFPEVLLAVLFLLVYYAPLALATLGRREWVGRIILVYVVVNAMSIMPLLKWLFGD